jgi:hypothetical protein
MRHTGRTMFAALVAVLALGVVASASASAALPEFVPGEGGFPIMLKGSVTGPASNFNIATGNVFGECHGYNINGEITGAKIGTLTIETKECAERSRHYHTQGAGEGDLVMPYTASLVYINKATKEVGLLLKLPAPEVIVRGNEKTLELAIRGSILVPLTPVNTKTSKLGLTFEGTGGNQAVSVYENEKGEKQKAKLESEPVSGGWWTTAFNMSGQISLAASKPLTVDA